MSSHELAGIPVDLGDMEELSARLREKWQGYVVSINLESFVYWQEAPYRAAVRGAALRLVDGVSVQWALRWRGLHVPRVPGIDFAWHLLPGRRVFLFGGAPGVAAAAAAVVEARQASVVGILDGRPERWEEAAEAIASTKPDLVLVGLGMPRQEYWMAAHPDLWRECVALGVGGALDVFSGRKRRAPRSWRAAGLEWAWRVIQEPARLPRLLRAQGAFLRALMGEWERNVRT